MFPYFKMPLKLKQKPRKKTIFINFKDLVFISKKIPKFGDKNPPIPIIY